MADVECGNGSVKSSAMDGMRETEKFAERNNATGERMSLLGTTYFFIQILPDSIISLKVSHTGDFPSILRITSVKFLADEELVVSET